MQISLFTSTDKIVWDDYVDNHPDAAPYCRFAWQEAVEQAYGHKPCYLAATERGVLKGILPLCIFRIPFSGSSFVSLPFCDVGDVFADNLEIKRSLLSEAIVLAKNANVKKVIVRSSQEDLLKNCLPGYHSEVQKGKVRMLLELPGSSEQLWQSFKSKLRSQVKKAEKNGLSFRWGNIDDLDVFYYVFSRNMHNLGSPVHSKEWIKNVLVNYGENARMGLVFKDKEPVGCGINLYTKHTASIPWASTLREYNRLSPNMLLYWNFLKYAADNTQKVFDFGRSTLDEGTYRFKKQWGAEPESLFWFQIHLSEIPGEGEYEAKTSNDRAMLANIWARLPLSLVNFVGPRVRKYISL